MHINCGNVGVIPFCARIHGTLMPVSPSLLTPSPSPVPPVSFLAHSCSHSDVFSIQGPKWLMRSPSLMTQVQTSSPWGQDWLPQVFLWFSHICMTCTLIHNRKKEEGDKERREHSVLISVWLVWLNTVIFSSIYFSTNGNILFFLLVT